MRIKNVVITGFIGLSLLMAGGALLLTSSTPALAQGGCTCYYGTLWCKDLYDQWYSTGRNCGSPGQPGSSGCTCYGGTTWCTDSSGAYQDTGNACGATPGGGGTCQCYNGQMWCKYGGVWSNTGTGSCWGGWWRPTR